MTTGVCHFKVDGPWLTQFSRMLWADEDSPHKALAVLDCLVSEDKSHEMNEEIALRILTGRAKLVGNSSDGISLEEDNTDVSEHGNALSLQARFRHLGFKAQEASFEIKCRDQIKAKRTEFVASPWGGIHIPLCAWEKIKTGEWSWKDLEPYVKGGDFPRTKRALAAMRAIYGYKDGDDIEYACDEVRMRSEIINKTSAESAIKKQDENALDFIAGAARANVSNLPFDGSILDQYIKDQTAMDKASNKPPEPAKDFSAENGWIAPNGDFFTCGMIQHDALADRMGAPTKDLEKTHVRISINPMSDYRSPVQFVGRNLTQKQKDAIWDWCEFHKKDVPPWVFGDKGTKFSKEES